MVAFVFPGQGSQKRGMGQGLFDSVHVYGECERQVDELLGYSVRDLCIHDAKNHLKDTQYTQPSLYVVNALHYYDAIKSVRPVAVAGHSLGEYNALLAAGVFDFLTGLRLVKKRGELMSRAKNGSMGAIVGLSADVVARVIADYDLSALDIANHNSPSQIVVAGPIDVIKRAGPIFENAGARMFVPLQVSAAFHSRYVREAAAEFAEFLSPLSFSVPQLAVVANVTAQPYPSLEVTESVKSLLVQQITGAVQWTRSIRFLMAQGIAEFKEIGPGNVLTRLVQQIQQEAAN